MCGTNLFKMFYIGILLVALSLYFCEGNIYTISGRIPPCNKSLDMTVRANSSEDRILLQCSISHATMVFTGVQGLRGSVKKGLKFARLCTWKYVNQKLKYRTIGYAMGLQWTYSPEFIILWRDRIHYNFKFTLVRPNRRDSGFIFCR